MKWRRLALSLCLATVARSVRAEDETKLARERFHKAEQAESAKRYEEALELFRSVLAVKSSASVLFHIAHCEGELGQLVRAREDYERAKAEATQRGQLDLAKTSDAALTATLHRMPRIGAKCVAKEPCTLTLNGKPFDGTLTRLDPGTHVLLAKGATGAELRREVTVREADVMDLELVLESQPASPPTPATAPPTHTAAALGVSSASQPSDLAPHPRSFALPIALSALSLVFVGAGILAYLNADAKADAAKRACAELISCEGSRSAVRTWDALALGAFGGAALSAGTAVYFFVAAPNQNGRAAVLGGTVQW